jgi:hypothetical protein
MSEPVHGGPVTDYVKEALDSLYHSLGDDETKVEAALRAFYTNYVKPIDLPWIPNRLVEPLVDSQLEELFVKGIIEAHARIHTEG